MAPERTGTGRGKTSTGSLWSRIAGLRRWRNRRSATAEMYGAMRMKARPAIAPAMKSTLSSAPSPTSAEEVPRKYKLIMLNSRW